jgi:hypothetical protein
MQTNSTVNPTETSTYIVLDTIPIGANTCKVISSEIIKSKEDNSETQLFYLEFVGKYSYAGIQKSWRKLGLQHKNDDGSPFIIKPLKTLDNCEVIVSKRADDDEEEGPRYFSVKGLSKDFEAEKQEAAKRASAVWK